jgi:hypothetical protein
VKLTAEQAERLEVRATLPGTNIKNAFCSAGAWDRGGAHGNGYLDQGRQLATGARGNGSTVHSQSHGRCVCTVTIVEIDDAESREEQACNSRHHNCFTKSYHRPTQSWILISSFGDLALPVHGPVRDRERHSRARPCGLFIDTPGGCGAEVENLRSIVSFCRSISLAVAFSLEVVCRCSPAAWHRGPSRRRPRRQGAVLVVRL